MVNAMVNTAVVSPLSDEEFHEVSEGLGILGRLPNEPGMSDAGAAAQAKNGARGRMISMRLTAYTDRDLTLIGCLTLAGNRWGGSAKGRH